MMGRKGKETVEAESKIIIGLQNQCKDKQKILYWSHIIMLRYSQIAACVTVVEGQDVRCYFPATGNNHSVLLNK